MNMTSSVAVLEEYQQRRELTPKSATAAALPHPLMDDNTYDTLDTSSTSIMEDHDLLDMSFTSFLPDDSTSTKYHQLGGGDNDSNHHEFMPTFNALVARSQCQKAENISAIGIIEKEQETERKNSQRASVMVQHFVEARVETFTKNLDFAQHEAENIINRNFAGDRRRRRRSTEDALSSSKEGNLSSSSSSNQQRISLPSVVTTLESISEHGLELEEQQHENNNKTNGNVVAFNSNTKRESLASLGSISTKADAEEVEEDNEEEVEIVEEEGEEATESSKNNGKRREMLKRSQSISDFVEARKNTFTRNVDFLVGQAGAWTKKLQQQGK